MAIILRYVNANGILLERFFEIVEVNDTTAATLKKAVCDALGRSNLDICNLRGQGYDGASNMRGAWNGLRALFLKDSPYAYYVHYFAHRLQLALVAACEKELSLWKFFSGLNCIVNLITASSKRQYQLRSAQAIDIQNMVATCERDTGRGANQIGNLQRPGKTRWSSHSESICGLIDMYGSVIIVLENIVLESSDNAMRGQANGSLIEMKSFDFIFILNVMHRVMAITNLLCQALQHKSLDILNAMSFVKTTKELLQSLRDNSFDIILMQVESVCSKHGIEIPNMDDPFKFATGRSCQQKDTITVKHHYHFDVFNSAIDFQVEELNSRFSDDAVELLSLSAALEPKDNFKLFNVDQICTLATKFYPGDFSDQEIHYLSCPLRHYERDIPHHAKFQDLTTISELCRRLMETNMAQHFNLIDRLIRLVLTLPVSTTSVERAFSAMKLVKTVLRNKMGEGYLANFMVIYVERELDQSINNDSIIDDFDSLKDRRAQL
ncbi:hypothetical protein OROMI_023091 [Orobanche minor]